MDAQKPSFLPGSLIDSPLSTKPSAGERHSPLSRAEASYPSPFADEDLDMVDGEPVGYESSWAGIFRG